MNSAEASLIKTPSRGSTSQGLAFLAILGFVGSFSTARTFTTFNPDIVVVSSGIHFHHFWYGLIMICVAGWLGIASTKPEWDRIYALVFGLGLGLIGDETGLLLTLGDYNSELTYVAVLVGLSVAFMTYLSLRYASSIKSEVLLLGRGERAIHVGVGIIATSSLAFAFGLISIGTAMLVLGVTLSIAGALVHGRRLPSNRNRVISSNPPNT